MCHTNLRYNEIGERTIPQLNAILDRLPKHLEIKIGVPGIFGFSSGSNKEEVNNFQGNVPDKPPKLSEIAAFCNTFNMVNK